MIELFSPIAWIRVNTRMASSLTPHGWFWQGFSSSTCSLHDIESWRKITKSTVSLLSPSQTTSYHADVTCKRRKLFLRFASLFYRRKFDLTGWQLPFQFSDASLPVFHCRQVEQKHRLQVPKRTTYSQEIKTKPMNPPASTSTDLSCRRDERPRSVMFPQLTISSDVNVSARGSSMGRDSSSK